MIKKTRGFTLIEILLIIAFLAVLFGIGVFGLFAFRKKSYLTNDVQKVANVLKIAKSKSMSFEGQSKYGVYFDNNVSPNQYMLFKGENYAQRDTSYREVYQLSKETLFEDVDFGGNKELTFANVNGFPNNSGNIKIILSSDISQSSFIYVDSLGRVDFSDSPAPSLDNLIKDSRHVHFDLGWSIANSSLLKFYFPSHAQTFSINTAVYFDVGKTFFDWEGKFEVASTSQVFRIHTHFLNEFAFPYTRISITRDRNKGKNDKEVIIYIVDEGTDKEIAHYFQDGVIIKGNNVQTMEIQ